MKTLKKQNGKNLLKWHEIRESTSSSNNNIVVKQTNCQCGFGTHARAVMV